MVDRDSGITHYRPHTHCHFCGENLDHATSYDGGRSCYRCRETNYQNPTPVAVLIVPNGNGGIFTVRRAIEPQKGKLALPGGYVLTGESWQRAGIRELNEELSIAACSLDDAEQRVQHLMTVSTPNGKQILIFGTVLAFHIGEFVPNEEALERVEYYPRDPLGVYERLCFPLHEAAVDVYLSTL
jgi:ADP-ribose pyrophosphatase YjhB (NUDIX family)